ncbi:MAG: RagB/SusD family nutrient uptake outer membrane protein [Tannerella sp.]|nr:RagB/SusD family nutrient uptake outer membrane protein [Tannerella sp.]
MRLNKYISLFISGLLLLSSCNDDFMQKDPKDTLVDETYWENAAHLRLYLNTLYPTYIVGHQTGWAYDTNYPSNLKGSHLMYGDAFSDNVVTLGTESDRLNGTMIVPTSGVTTCWKWDDLRKINYFLQRYHLALKNESQQTVNMYAGEACFFKAWDYYNKVAALGDVPWISTDLNVDSEELFAARTPRSEVMDSVLRCINLAIEWLPEKGKESENGRLNKDHANFLKARICLYEGAYRKYHAELGLQNTADKFFEECVAACQSLINGGKYRLFDDGSDNPYWKLFAMKGDEPNSNPEVILARVYLGVSYGHTSQRYFHQNSSGNYTRQGANRALVDEYLCIDGRPIYAGGSEGNYEKNPHFMGYGKWTELENRDPRLTQTICKPGEYFTIFDGGVWLEDRINYPSVSHNAGGSSISGYRIIKHWMGDWEEYSAVTNGSQSAVEFRYAEVLLNYAEAKYELGDITQEDVDLTINALRQRAGFDFTAYPTARLVIGQEPDDPYLDAIYKNKLEYPVPPLLREIRRERRVELAIEDRRYQDLMRWKAAPLLTVPRRGMNFLAVQDLYDGTHTSPPEVAPQMALNKDVYVDGDGFIIIHPLSPHITNGTLPWDDYRYYFPIPKDQLELNPNLKQNPGWENK